MQTMAPAQLPKATLTTDASGRWGCGGFWLEQKQWIQCPWQEEWNDTPIHTKELLPIILAIATWGPYWHSSLVQVHCDNMAVVNIIASNSSRDKLAMHLLRALHFVCAFYSIQLSVKHIPGSDNTIADAISRRFSSLTCQEPARSQHPYQTRCGQFWSATSQTVYQPLSKCC